MYFDSSGGGGGVVDVRKRDLLQLAAIMIIIMTGVTWLCSGG